MVLARHLNLRNINIIKRECYQSDIIISILLLANVIRVIVYWRVILKLWRGNAKNTGENLQKICPVSEPCDTLLNLGYEETTVRRPAADTHTHTHSHTNSCLQSLHKVAI